MNKIDTTFQEILNFAIEGESPERRAAVIKKFKTDWPNFRDDLRQEVIGQATHYGEWARRAESQGDPNHREYKRISDYLERASDELALKKPHS